MERDWTVFALIRQEYEVNSSNILIYVTKPKLKMLILVSYELCRKKNRFSCYQHAVNYFDTQCTGRTKPFSVDTLRGPQCTYVNHFMNYSLLAGLMVQRPK